MSHEDPTLKIRVQLPDRGSHLARDCYDVAKRMVGDGGRVLDAKWGREPTKWTETGGGWGRPKLQPEERGYVEACRDILADEDAVVSGLLAIIDRLTGGKS